MIPASPSLDRHRDYCSIDAVSSFIQVSFAKIAHDSEGESSLISVWLGLLAGALPQPLPPIDKGQSSVAIVTAPGQPWQGPRQILAAGQMH